MREILQDLNAKPEHVESVVDYCTSSYLQEGVSKDSVWSETDEYLRDALQSVLQDMEVIGTDIARRTDKLANEVGNLEQDVEAISHRLSLGRRWAASENLSDLTVPVDEPPPLAKIATVAGDDRPINCRPMAPYSRITLKERLRDVYYKREAPPPVDVIDDSSSSRYPVNNKSVSSKNGSTLSTPGTSRIPPLAKEVPSRLSLGSTRSCDSEADKSGLDVSKERGEDRSREQAARLSVPRPSVSSTGLGQVPFRPRVRNSVGSSTTRTSIGLARDWPTQKPPELLSKRPSLGVAPPKLSAASRTPEYESPPPTPPKSKTSIQFSPPPTPPKPKISLQSSPPPTSPKPMTSPQASPPPTPPKPMTSPQTSPPPTPPKPKTSLQASPPFPPPPLSPASKAGDISNVLILPPTFPPPPPLPTLEEDDTYGIRISPPTEPPPPPPPPRPEE